MYSSRSAIAVFANSSAAISRFTAPRSRLSAPGRTRRGSRTAAGIQDSRDPPSRLTDEPSPAGLLWLPVARPSVTAAAPWACPGGPHCRTVLRSGRACPNDDLCRPARLAGRCARPPAFARPGPGPGPRIFAQPRGGHRTAGDASGIATSSSEAGRVGCRRLGTAWLMRLMPVVPSPRPCRQWTRRCQVTAG
jgi:hypothetical protein